MTSRRDILKGLLGLTCAAALPWPFQDEQKIASHVFRMKAITSRGAYYAPGLSRILRRGPGLLTFEFDAIDVMESFTVGECQIETDLDYLTPDLGWAKRLPYNICCCNGDTLKFTYHLALNGLSSEGTVQQMLNDIERGMCDDLLLQSIEESRNFSAQPEISLPNWSFDE